MASTERLPPGQGHQRLLLTFAHNSWFLLKVSSIDFILLLLLRIDFCVLGSDPDLNLILQCLKVSDSTFPLPISVSGRLWTSGPANLTCLLIDTSGVLRQWFLFLVGVPNAGMLLKLSNGFLFLATVFATIICQPKRGARQLSEIPCTSC